MESNNIMVSISCLVYNHEPYLRDCLEGFVNQKTNFKYEVIIHDDASTDKSADIIREYEEKYPDIIKPIYQTENQHSQNIPYGKLYMFPKMSGKYIASCEGDDYWCDVNKLQKQVDFLESHSEYSACVHNSIRLDCRDNSEKLFNDSTSDCDLFFEDIVEKGGAKFHTSSVMKRREYIERPKEFWVKGFGDYPNALYLALSGKIRYFGDVMSVYRFFSVGSWSERKEAGGVKANIEHHKAVISLLKSVDEYSNGEYHDLINNVILDNEVDILDNNYDYRRILLNKKYRSIYIKKFSKKKAIIMIMGFIFPKTVKKYFVRKRIG